MPLIIDLLPPRHLANRSSDCTGEVLADRETPEDRLVIEPEPFRPLGKRVRFALVGDEPAGCAVASLGGPYRPDAVVWFVIAVIVLSLYAVFAAGSRPHVSVKVLERMPPSLANLDAAVKVPPLFVGLGERASRNHVSPARVLPRIEHSMGSFSLAGGISRETAATLNAATPEIARIHDCRLSTLALAKPSREAAMRSGTLDDREAAESLSGQVIEVPRRYTVRHCEAPLLNSRNDKTSIGKTAPLCNDMEAIPC